MVPHLFVCNVSNANVLFLWIGNNDVLGYATTGGDGTDPRPAGAAGVGFDATYDALVNTLISGGLKVVAFLM
jgi:hypothetical protein